MMSNFVFEIDAEHNIYPNITVYKRFYDGGFTGWRIRTNDSYVMYHANANDTEIDPITGEIIPVIYYYTEADKPATYNWSWFDYVAVPRSSVDENYIFSLPGEAPEIM